MVAFNKNSLIGQEMLKCPLSAFTGVPIEWVEFYRENVLRAFPGTKKKTVRKATVLISVKYLFGEANIA